MKPIIAYTLLLFLTVNAAILSHFKLPFQFILPLFLAKFLIVFWIFMEMKHSHAFWKAAAIFYAIIIGVSFWLF
ncbi:MAG: hypothetical protein IPP61_03495 [Cytophagaceae bacterium]|nr:hypothetical protein [Cytophagaceae bacterium]MCA0365700.1 hypothetical protein [Bacteroidota bacterium]